MSFKLQTNPPKIFTPPAAGAYPAVCYRLIDYGLQPREWQGQQLSPCQQILISWELLGTVIPDDEEGRPYTVHKKYNVFLGDQAKLREHLEQWQGRPFTDDELREPDIASFYGRHCTLLLTHKARKDGTVSAEIAGLAPLSSTQAPHNKMVLFSFSDFSPVVFNDLPGNIKDTIRKSVDYEIAIHGDQAVVDSTVAAVRATKGEPSKVESNELLSEEEIPF